MLVSGAVGKTCSTFSFGLVLLLPPLIWWQGLSSPWVSRLLLAIGLFWFLGARSDFARLQAIATIFIGAFVALGSQQLTLYYPVLVNAALLIVWFHSWCFPPTLIERIASKSDVRNEQKRLYMRHLTLAWCGVFLINLSIALVTTQLQDLTWWIGWNGLGAYLFIGLFAGTEYLFRKWKHSRIDEDNLM